MSKFYGIGVGPGDKELLTIKAVKALAILDILILPEAKKHTKSIAYEIAKDYIKPTTEIIYMEFPMVQCYETILKAGKETAKHIKKHIEENKNVGFITLGDPSIYSTYGYILKSLDSDIEVQTIPGITSFCAAAAALNKPLAEREEILSIIPSTAPRHKIQQAISVSGGIAFMKVYNNSEKIVEILESEDILNYSTLIQRCATKDCAIDKNIKDGLAKGKQYLSIILTRRELE